MAIDVADWLRGLSLEQYAKAFRDSDIDESVLGHLTADDLIEVGVASIGHRLKAEMLLAQATPRTGDAEQCLQAAIALAKEQDAKFWELRAATALGEHWTAAGRPDEARNLLAPVYGSFTQGLDSPDLKRAAALIA
ncbi:MAG TPA: hypothetical protein VEP47_15315 [Reyranella sp.]|nr:hypothetical protein [Reyranella sp.]